MAMYENESTPEEDKHSRLVLKGSSRGVLLGWNGGADLRKGAEWDAPGPAPDSVDRLRGAWCDQVGDKASKEADDARQLREAES
jgi:hypothetical protein